MKKYFLFSLLAVAALTLSACGASSSSQSTTTVPDDSSVTPAPAAPSNPAASSANNGGVNKDEIKQELAGIPGADSSAPADSSGQTASDNNKTTMMTLDPSKFTDLTQKYTEAVFSTNMGDFTVKFNADKAPKTVNNFLNLANVGYYNGVRFHRVIAGFMIQGGDQYSKDDSLQAKWGTGGPGYAIQDELGTGLSNVRGSIAMANAGPNTGGSQFFVNVVDNSANLDSGYPVFGAVIAGMDVVDKIAAVAVTPDNNRPLSPVTINSVTLK